ncbi:unnamed protein product [marine sediment metagenome]|uniref:Uncharacterized protein n=1 Tax=marine sediment metagenome TaxID=412755 RepID=X1KFS7_9ZZZZ
MDTGGDKMSYTEKMDVLDLLINILREHEEKLDELVERLEMVVDIVAKNYPDTPLKDIENMEAERDKGL